MTQLIDKIWSKIEKAVFIVAECDKNYFQSDEDQPVAVYLENAKKLAKAAKEAGADAVKFQNHTVEDEQLKVEVVSPHLKIERYKWITRSTLATPINEFWLPLKKYCQDLGIILFATPFSRGAAQELTEVDLPLWKVGSGDPLDFVMLDYLCQTQKPIIISSGMSTLDEIDSAVDFLKKRKARFALLHCVSGYPVPAESSNLKTIEFYQKRYQIPIGFSDHSLGTDMALAAVAMGAKVIEKHFSLSRDLWWGADHKMSMTPAEFKVLVKKIRRLERALGRPAKILQEGEAALRPVFRKSLVAGRDIPRGTVLTPEMIYAMRPQKHIKGLPSEKYEEILAKKTKVDLKKYDPITFEVLE